MTRTREIAAEDLGLRDSRTYEVAGDVPAGPRLAIVGSRAAHRPQLELVPVLVAGAQSAGWAVVSGGAIGVDADAHRAALDQGVRQVAVLPCGPDLLYPPRHADLFAEIVDTGAGALVFAQPRGTEPTRGMFASRNRLVVGLCAAVIVVEAAVPSGSFGTGRAALRSDAAVGAVVGSSGTAALVARGAWPIALDWADERETIRAVSGWLTGVARGEDARLDRAVWPPHLGWLEGALRQRGTKGVTLDALGDPLRAAVALAEAETLGLVTEVGPGCWVSCA